MTIRVLIAAHDDSVAGLLETSLRRYGFSCTVAADGEGAATLLERESFDVAVLDTWLRKKDGIALAGELRLTLKGKKLGICVINTDPTARDRRDQLMQKAGVDAWFDLPFSIAEVRKKLAELAHRYTGATADAMPVADAPARRALHELRAPSAGAASRTGSDEPGAALAPWPRALSSQLAASGLMLELCRARTTGVLVLHNRGSEARVGFLRGVLVGATDNGHDNRIGPRLLRRGLLQESDVAGVQEWRHAHGGRVGDAILALGILDAATLIEELRAQTYDRLVQAAAWDEGQARLQRDERELLDLAVDAFDVIEIVLRAFTTEPDMDAVTRFVTERGDEGVVPTVDFEEGLVSYARVAPRSPLPLVLMSSSSTLRAILTTLSVYPQPPKTSFAADFVALWRAGLVQLSGDPPRDPRPTPRPWRPEQVASDVLDRDTANLVQRAWLQVQGRDLYTALNVDAAASPEDIAAALAPLQALAARAADKKLGPAGAAARELSAFVDDAAASLLDAKARGDYDAARPVRVDSAALIASEEAFLQGKLALLDGAVDRAIAAFAEALHSAPDDAEIAAWLGWARFLDAAERLGEATALIKRARYDSPRAARPLLFLAQIAEQQGDAAAAERQIRDALRRCPDDPDVAKAAARLLGRPASARAHPDRES